MFGIFFWLDFKIVECRCNKNACISIQSDYIWSMKTDILTIRIDSEIKKKLSDLASKDKRSLSSFIAIELEKLTKKK